MKISTITKQVFCIILILALSLCGIFPTTASTGSASNPVTVILDGKHIVFDSPPEVITGRTMVPFRAIFEALGYSVDWNGANRTITAVNKSVTILMKIGDREVKCGDELIISDVAPYTRSGRTYVPLRLVSELSGCDVLWDHNTRTALIYRGQPEDYTPIRFTYSFIVSDGKNLYISAQKNDPEPSRMTMEIDLREETVKELFPYSANDYFLYKGKLYGRYGLSSRLSYGSYDLTTGELRDITGVDVASCYIYNDQLYYTDIDFGPYKTTLYRMNLDGTNTTKLLEGNDDFPIGDYAIVDDILFSGYMDSLFVMPLTTLKPVDLVELSGLDRDAYRKQGMTVLVNGLAISGDYFYAGMSLSKGLDDTPLGILQYNYKTGDHKWIELDFVTEEIVVTENSIFFTVFLSYEEDGLAYNLYRAGIDGSMPVLIMRFYGNQFGDWTISGNHIYFKLKLDESKAALGRVNTDGSEYLELMTYDLS